VAVCISLCFLFHVFMECLCKVYAGLVG
jgi:hypothetical protein